MAPPPHPFPVSHLPQRTHTHLSKTGHPKPRKLPRDFDLARDCELMELVQYSCTPWQEMIALQLEGRQQECWPVVRLFRRCREGKKLFHVETTAWEGEGAWQGKASENGSSAGNEGAKATSGTITSRNMFAQYGSYFWSKQS